MNIEQYINNRVNNQIDWHDKKSVWNEWAYLCCSIIAIVGSIVASIMIQYCENLATALSALVAISVGLNNLFKFQKKWILYRATSELLKSEKMQFQVKSGCYSGSSENCEKLFYDKIESILNNTNQEWTQFFDSENNE